MQVQLTPDETGAVVADIVDALATNPTFMTDLTEALVARVTHAQQSNGHGPRDERLDLLRWLNGSGILKDDHGEWDEPQLADLLDAYEDQIA